MQQDETSDGSSSSSKERNGQNKMMVRSQFSGASLCMCTRNLFSLKPMAQHVLVFLIFLLSIFLTVKWAGNDERQWAVVSVKASELKTNTTNNYYNNENYTVIFIHFHKAGGTSMVGKFRQTHTVFKTSRNGNPWIKDPKTGNEFLHAYWLYPPTEFQHFISQARNQEKVNFMASEWNFLHQNISKKHLQSVQVDLIATFRDPYDRFVSNLFFSSSGRKHIDDPWKWTQEDRFWKKRGGYGIFVDDIFQQMGTGFPTNTNKPNYYVAFLNGLAQEPGYNFSDMTREHHLEVAKERLQMFEAIIILERPETYLALSKWMPDGNVSLPHKNAAGTGKKKKAKVPINFTRAEFYKHNALDLELYKYATELALSRIR